MPEAKKYRKLPVEIEATQWFRNGDHPLDNATEMFDYPSGPRPHVIREGEIVRRFRHPFTWGDSTCEHANCIATMHDHGWIDTAEGGHIVCPGDFIITGVKGERYPCKPDIFALTYAAVDEAKPSPLAEMEARKDAAYYERNQLVAALSKLFPSGVARAAIEGWSEDWHNCVYIDLPTGQASWHFHDSQSDLFAHLPPYEGVWDGHTTEEKYARVQELLPSIPALRHGGRPMTLKEISDDEERAGLADALNNLRP